MDNGIRQESCLSPKLFSTYVDDLNNILNDSLVGCYVGGLCVNNISYADDLVLVAPDARSMNILLEKCNKFALQHFITYSVVKSVGMCIKPNRMQDLMPPNFTLGKVRLTMSMNLNISDI